MTPHRMALLSFTGLVAVAGAPAWSQEIAVLGPPTQAYEGQRTIVTPDVSLVQSVHSKPGKNRTESTISGQSVIQIWRDDYKKLWSISPNEGFAMEIPYGSDQARNPIGVPDEETALLEKRFIGRETVNGVATEHYYMRATLSGGGSTTGDVWATPSRITVRMRMTQTEPGSAPQQIAYDLTNLKIADQPDALFEVPAGYQVMSLGAGGVPSVVNGVGGYVGDVATDTATEARNEADRQVRNKAKDEARKAVRKILRW
ncbi:MAG: hypothetical protein R3C52_10760 [Hyphomonadaceae bacterium]